MKEFFIGQMDYISFIYGLSFFLLFFVCIFLHKQHKSIIPWNFLGLFGLIHGTNEWLDLMASSLGDGSLFQWTRLTIMAVSFIFLFEFGRLTCERFKYIRIGQWIYIPIILVLFLEISTGVSGLNAIVRYSLGFIGSLWAALAFRRMSREKKEGSWDLPLAAISMAVYALVAGLFINNDLFLNITGIPVQFIRGFTACLIIGSIWHHYEEQRAEDLGTELVHKEIRFGASVVLVLIFILLIGWLWIDQVGQNEVGEQRAKLLVFSQQVFETLDLEQVKILTGSSDDINNSEYIILKNELQQIHDTMNPVRFVYLMRKVEGKIVFLVDSEPPGSKDESPPGKEYVKGSPKLRQVFNPGGRSTFDEYTNRSGAWVSVFTPLFDERSGELVAVLGLDEDAHNFNSFVKIERLKAIILIGIICLSALLIFVYWQRFIIGIRQKNGTRENDLLLHWGVAVIVGIIGITLTVFLFCELRSDAWELFQTTFQQRAKTRVESVFQEVQRQLDRLNGLRQFMGTNEFMEREVFDQYVSPFLKDVPVHAFVWVPRVKSEDRLFYESSARQDGLDGYQFYEKEANGKKIPVKKRDEYYPVYYDQPVTGNEEAMGFDEASEPERRAAMEKSCDTGQPVITPPLVLKQAGEKQNGLGFLIFMPVYSMDLPKYTVLQRRKSLKGFVLGVYSAQEFLKNTYSKMPAEGLACLIEDPMTLKDRQVLYRHKIRIGTVDWSHPVLKYEVPLNIADRQWHVTIVPGSAFIERNLSRVYWWVLLIGLFMTTVVAVFLNFLATARYRAEKLVKIRTDELIKEKESLRKREEDYHLILDSTAEAIYGIDLNGNCTFCNPSCARMLGYSNIHDLLGKNMHALIHHSYPDGTPLPVENCQLYAAFKNNMKLHLEEVFWRFDGTSFFVEVWSYPEIRDGQVVGAVVSFLDITDRKKEGEALQESKERYKKITSSITDYIYHVHIDNGKPISTTYSPGCLRVTGYSPEDFLSNSSLWFQIVLEEDRHIVERQIQEVFLGKTIEPVEHRIKHKDGQICWVSNTIVSQFDANGKLVGYDGLIANITERKKAEEALNKAKETAEEALAIKDEFTSTVSHELRTPLASIKSSIDILDTEVPGVLTKDQKIFIKRVKSNIDRLARLINDVLDLSKLEAGKMVMNLMPLRAEALIQEVVDSQDPLVKAKGLTISTEFDKGLPVLIADKDRLIQVLNNLINNALKFTKEGGIVVSVHSEDMQNITFSVRDTGVGIKDEDLTKLFQKFQQVGGASQQVAGTGLGLAICKLIVAKHKGRIWVESQYGQGSAFKFSIPVRKEKRILIVDDDEATLDVLKNILEKEEIYEIEMATDGFRAGQKYYDFSPQLIILDINLPKINGLEVCSRIKNDPKTAHTKIIILSSFNTDERKKEAWDAGADEILNKPINLEELIAKVRKLI